ncbi:MAG: hypothetical protein JNK29_20150 [Anaerolineales bacterium]|nr:hypothetical protein [Anaerolineales bacterium]
MTNPYLLMTLLYAALAVLAALDASLASLNLLPWFNGLRWLRVHLITLGMLTQISFGLAPVLAAARAGRPRPATRWDIWLALNAGLLVLLVGIPLVNAALILAGGTLAFAAALLLVTHLLGLRPPAPDPARGAAGPGGRRFYLAGLAFLMLGIIVGTGLWLGWGPALGIQVPIEVHIHANNWGFMALVFAGLLADLYPGFAGRPLAWPRSLTPIFWMMTAGALLLVLGPWTKNELFTVPGILLHLSATGWLLANVIAPLRTERPAWKQPGLWQLVTAYVWIIAPVLVAPLILLKVPGFPGAGIEQNAPQALVYGWVLQFGLALLPYLFARLLFPERPARLGGSWFSLAAVHLGGGLLWASIFVKDYSTWLHGSAYALWVAALLPGVWQLWQSARAGWAWLEAQEAAPAPQPTSGD